MIHTEGLTKRYGDYVAVDDLDLAVADGTVVSLLGPNGAGKTTTVRMLATLIAPDAGRASVDANLTARENLVLMAQLRGRRRAASGRRADELLERFDSTDYRDRLVKNLSGGQRRRVDLAAGLINTPRVLVLDEPTTGLDPRSRQVVWSTVRELVGEGVSLLLTTQYLEEADALADRVVLLDRGREVAAGTPAELKSQVGGLRVDVVAADAEAFVRLRELLGGQFEITEQAEQRTLSVPAPDEAADLSRVAGVVADAGIPIDEVALRRPSLDDAFLALTGHPVDDTPADTVDHDSAEALA